MKDEDKTKERLINELSELRQRITELEISEMERNRAEGALKSERDKLQALVDGLAHTEIGIDIVGTDYKIFFQNPTLEERFGGLTEELCYEKYMGMNEPCDSCPMIKAIKSNKVESVELTGADGRNYVLFSAPFINPDGTIDRAIEVVLDITERKQAEEALHESEKRFHAIFEQAADSIVLIDAENGELVEFNGRAHENLGFTREEFRRLKIPDFEVIETSEEVEKHIKKIIKEGTDTFETKHKTKGGEIRDILVSSRVISIRGKKFIHCIWRDISERKQTENALKKSERRYQDLIEFANAGILVTENGKITQVNKIAEEIYGYSREELIGQSASILTPEKYRKQHKELLKEIMKSEKFKIAVSEEKGIKKDGTLFPIEISFSLVQPEGNTIIAVMRDITERREIEHKLLQSEKLRSLGELAGGVAHDFNNVLAAILGNAQLLKMGVEAPLGIQERRESIQEMNKRLDVIVNAARDGAETVRRIQEFARRKDEDKYFASVNINEVVDNALEFTRIKWKDEAESKGMKIDIQKELSPLPLTTGSASELREVITNLINNAVDAMPQGGQIKIKTFRQEGHIAIRVEDTGIGMPKAIRDRIFDPFFTTKGVRSSGLGLSVSFGIINRHRGTVTVDSVEGKGTAFTIKLPISEKIVEEKKEKPMPDEKQKARILVIEDEEQVGNVLYDILSDAGHEVKIAFDGRQGVKMFEEKGFDLVFTDLGMPGISGWQVAEKIKSINNKVPVALITGWDVELKESEMKDKWVDLIVRKPFEVDQVLRLVQEGMVLKDRCKEV